MKSKKLNLLLAVILVAFILSLFGFSSKAALAQYGGCGPAVDIGLRLYQDGAARTVYVNSAAVSPLKVYKDGVTYSVRLSTPGAAGTSRMYIQTPAGTMAICIGIDDSGGGGDGGGDECEGTCCPNGTWPDEHGWCDGDGECVTGYIGDMEINTGTMCCGLTCSGGLCEDYAHGICSDGDFN